MDLKEQRRIGRVGANMLTRSLQRTIQKHKLSKTTNQIRQNKDGEDISSLTEAKGEFRIRRNKLVGLAIVMGKHGFVLDAGVDDERLKNRVNRTKPKSIFYERKSHQFDLKNRDFLNQAVDSSNAVHYLAQELGYTYADEVMEQIKFGNG
ncbi:hypothetical protein [Empedobacter tilapiae]